LHLDLNAIAQAPETLLGGISVEVCNSLFIMSHDKPGRNRQSRLV